MLNAIHHIAIIVSDYEKSKDFYVNKLGFEVIREVVRPQNNDIKLDLKLAGRELEIFAKTDAPARPTNPEALGLRHLAFKVEKIEPAVAWLKSMGIETEPIRTDPYTNNKMTFFRDPDMLPLELHE